MKKLEVFGYLNKITGRLSTPAEQPAAAEMPEVYEALYRHTDLLALTAEKVTLEKLVDKMADIGDLINTQSNRCTDQPFFAVMTKKEEPASEDHGFDRIAWVHPDRDYAEADERTSGRLDALYDDGREIKGWERIPVKKVDEFRIGCFTEQGCKDYIGRNGHNLREPFIFAFGTYRNCEYQEVRNFLITVANQRARRTV